MTERWERALGTLDRLEPPPDLLETARTGPRRTDPSPRRGVVATLAAVLTLAAFAAISASLWGLTGLVGGGDERMRFGTETSLDAVPTIPGETWPGLWPQVTRGTAEFTADAPNAHEHFQVRPEAVVSEYARDVFGWKDREIEELQSDGARRVFRVWRCSTDESCDRSIGADVVVEQLLGPDPGYWFVTALRFATDDPRASDLSDRAAAELLRTRASAVVSLFVVSRLDRNDPALGSEAEYGTAQRYLSAQAARSYSEHDGGLHLYGWPDGHPRLRYRGFDLIGGPAPMERGELEATVGIYGVPVGGGAPEYFREQLILEAVEGRILITGAEPA